MTRNALKVVITRISSLIKREEISFIGHSTPSDNCDDNIKGKIKGFMQTAILDALTQFY